MEQAVLVVLCAGTATRYVKGIGDLTRISDKYKSQLGGVLRI